MASSLPCRPPSYRRVLSTIFAYDLALAILGVPTTVLMAYKACIDGYGWIWYLLAIAVSLVLLLKIRFSYKQEAAKEAESLNALEGALHTLHSILIRYASIHAKPPQLRITIHAVVQPKRGPGDAELVQLVDYVGDQRKKKTAWRKSPINGGIIGEVMLTKELAVGKRTDPSTETYVQELQSKWRYPPEKARSIDTSSMSWLAIPLVDSKQEILAILFADSVNPEFFTDELVLLADSATAGIAEFVKARIL